MDLELELDYGYEEDNLSEFYDGFLPVDRFCFECGNQDLYDQSCPYCGCCVHYEDSDCLCDSIDCKCATKTEA